MLLHIYTIKIPNSCISVVTRDTKLHWQAQYTLGKLRVVANNAGALEATDSQSHHDRMDSPATDSCMSRLHPVDTALSPILPTTLL